MSYRRGEVVLVLFPNSDLRTSKRRPAVVVQSDHLDSGLPQTIVAMITSNMARAGKACRVTVRATRESNRAGRRDSFSSLIQARVASLLSDADARC